MNTIGKDIVTFRGKRYRKDCDSGYFKRIENGTSIYLHREIYQSYHGSIPAGHEVHHRDHDKDNNDVSNLVLLSSEEHKKLHGREMSEEERERRRRNMELVARPKAVEWHKSEEGRTWHRLHYEKTKAALQADVDLVCKNCKNHFIGKAKSRFCSNKCKSAWRRKQGIDDVVSECPVCHSEFRHNKYRKSETCSRSCANRYRAMKRRGES